LSAEPGNSVHRLLFNQRELRAGWRLLIFVALVIAFTFGVRLAVKWLSPHADSDTRFILREVTDFLVFLLASWIMARYEKRSIADYGLPWRRMFQTRFWQGMALGFAAISVLIGALRLAGVFRIERLALHGANVWRWAAIYFIVFVLVALREEFRARGYALYTLTAGFGFWPAALPTSAFFGYSHVGNRGEDWIGLFNAAFVGVLFCFLVRRTGDLWMPIGFHLAFDWGQTYFYGVADSGNVTPGHLLDSASSGPAWLSGGAVGPEGSALCTAVIALVWLLCAFWLHQTGYPRSAIE